MAILFEIGEVVAAPPTGKRYLKLDDDGAAAIVSPDGTESVIGTPSVATINAAAALTDFRSAALVAAGQSITVTGLDGEADGDYDVYFYLYGAANTGAIKLQFNDADADLYSAWNEVAGAVPGGGRSTTTCQLITTCSDNTDLSGWIRIRSSAAAGGAAFRTGSYQVLGGDGPVARNGVFTQTAVAPITSLRIIATNAASLDTQSYMVVRKLHKQF